MELTLGKSTAQLRDAGAKREEIVLEETGDTCGADSSVAPHAAPDEVYTLALPVDADLDLSTCLPDTAKGAFDSMISVVKGCAGDPAAIELAHAGLNHLDRSCPKGQRGAALFVSVPAGDYSIVVTGRDSDCGKFTLRLGVTPAPGAKDSARHARDRNDHDGASDGSALASLDEGALDGPDEDGDRTHHGCTCSEEWTMHDTVYHGCDARHPGSHGAWCPTMESGCGKMLHGSFNNVRPSAWHPASCRPPRSHAAMCAPSTQTKHPSETGHWDWCDAPPSKLSDESPSLPFAEDFASPLSWLAIVAVGSALEAARRRLRSRGLRGPHADESGSVLRMM